jgi:hypothetical protein
MSDTMPHAAFIELWDRERLDEPGVARSQDGRRRLVAPGWEIANE